MSGDLIALCDNCNFRDDDPPSDPWECPQCGEPLLRLAVEAPCPGEPCDDEDHHHTFGTHISEIEG